jgi:hypothetical protein
VEEPTMRRPAWVWVISVYYWSMFVFSYVGLFLILSRLIPVPDAIGARVNTLSTIEWVVLVVQSFIAVSGATTLFFLRKPAYPVFVTGFAIGVGWLLWRSPSLMSVLGMTILAAVCLYTRTLSKQGKLT